MIAKFVERWEANKESVRRIFSENHPGNYQKIVQHVISAITAGDYDDFNPDPNRIHEIDDGDYQGTLLYVIGAKGYQPSTYWSVFVGYGSCSGCDTLEAIRDYSGKKPSEDQVNDYMTLALHIVQGLKEIGSHE